MYKEITSKNNELIKKIKALAVKKGREEQKRFLAEGVKLVEEALTYCPDKMRILLIDRENAVGFKKLAENAAKAGAEVYIVTDEILKWISDVKTPQGLAAAIEIFPQKIRYDSDFLIALDSVNDPSNIGAVIRTADAAGVDGVILSEDCSDVYSPKSVRASMGSVFHTDIVTANLHYALERLKKDGFKIYAAHLAGSEDYYFDNKDKICLVIGNEAHGIRKNISDICGGLIKIPIYGKAESLNASVAAGIILYEIAKVKRNG